MEKQLSTPLSQEERLANLFNWVESYGGLHSVYSKEIYPGSEQRGLFSRCDFSDPNSPVVQIPNRLIVSPYHIRGHHVDEGGSVSYAQLFEREKKLFDPAFPAKEDRVVRGKWENEYGEYFQLALFLIVERMKGQKSFWKPFLDSLPEKIDTLFSVKEGEQIRQGSDITILDEIQYMEDDIFDKIRLDRFEHEQCKARLLSFLQSDQSFLSPLLPIDYLLQNYDSLFEWAWMNVGTRCFGTHHLPSSISMVPLLDLVNHTATSDSVKYYLLPYELHRKMVNRGIDVLTNKELEINRQAMLDGFEDYSHEDEIQTTGLDQHQDDYPDRYYNYLPKKRLVQIDEDEEGEEFQISIEPIEKAWNLKDDAVAFGIKPVNKNYLFKKDEEVFLSYGERANSFLVVEYGFALENNRFDFVRIKGIGYEYLQKIANGEGLQLVHDNVFLERLNGFRMKQIIQADLKMWYLNVDLVKFIKFALPEEADLKTILKVYLQVVMERIGKYKTTLKEDLELLNEVKIDQRSTKQYHWIYEFVLIYRIGQKQILEYQRSAILAMLDLLSNSDKMIDFFQGKQNYEKYFNIDSVNELGVILKQLEELESRIRAKEDEKQQLAQKQLQPVN